MDKKINIMCALANTGRKSSDKCLIDFFVENIDGIECRQTFIGSGIKNSLDWKMIMDSVSFVSSIVTIADVIWAAYNKFVLPEKNKNKDAFLFIQINNNDRIFKTFAIGKQYKDHDIFIKEFKAEAKNIVTSEEYILIEKTILEKQIIKEKNNKR